MRPVYLDFFSSHWHGTGYVTGSGVTSTTLSSLAAAGAGTISLTSSSGFLAGELIVIGTGGVFQTTVVGSVVGNDLTISPTIQAGGFANGSPVTHGWGNDSHPVYALAYAAFAQAIADSRRPLDASRYVFEDPGAAYVAYIGDSWGDGVNEAADQFKTALETRFGHAINWKNASLTGNRLDQMTARMEQEVIPYRPRYLVVQYGANDLSQGRSQALMEADFDAMALKCRLNGIVPVFPGLPPIASVLATATLRNEQVKARAAAAP